MWWLRWRFLVRQRPAEALDADDFSLKLKDRKVPFAESAFRLLGTVT